MRMNESGKTTKSSKKNIINMQPKKTKKNNGNVTKCDK